MIGLDKAIISMLIVLIVLVSYCEYEQQPTNFEECVLHHMKGQEGKVLPIAIRLCKREFPKWEVN